MISALRQAWHGLWGSGEFSVTVPIMDGALRPNNALDTAETLLLAPDADNLAGHAGKLYFTQGRRLMTLGVAKAGPVVVEELAADVAALAVSRDGEVVVALDDGNILTRGAVESGEWARVDFQGEPAHVTAMAFGPTGDLYLCLGSRAHRASQWKHDLMRLGASGSVWVLRKGDRVPARIADGLAYPSGIGFLTDGRPLVSEAWKHRLVGLDDSGRATPVLADLPGYPGRILSTDDGAHWLCLFAPRSQMIEFVLRERTYREQMVDTIDERFWMAPTLRAGRNFKEPVQGGGIRHLGIQKPWGPTRSSGLIVRIEGRNRIAASLHSRSDGNRHGMTSIADWNGRLVASSRGDGALVVLPGAGRKQ
jgi:hypothetical protein